MFNPKSHDMILAIDLLMAFVHTREFEKIVRTRTSEL